MSDRSKAGSEENAGAFQTQGSVAQVTTRVD